MSGGYERAALFENRFWLQILGDHSIFIYNSLSPGEINMIRKSEYFINVFEQLLNEVRNPLTRGELIDLIQRSYENSQALRSFKLDIQRQQLLNEISINLTPTFINHMVNEVEDYLRILGSLSVGEVPPLCHPNYYHLLWLLDAKGHAAALANLFDEVEYVLIEKSQDFTAVFGNLYQKAIEIQGYMRTSVSQFPALSCFNIQAEQAMVSFKDFLNEMTEARKGKTVLSSFSSLLTDHMAREECYYLVKLAQVSEAGYPDCNPERPRSN